MKIKHDSRKAEYREPFGAAKTGTKVSLTIEINDPVPESVRLMLWHGDDPEVSYLEMSEAGEGRYTAAFPLPDEGCLVWYAFEIETEDDDERAVIYYGNNTEDLGGEGRTYLDDPHRYQITVYKESEVPEWYRDGIVYQIFPDRFVRDDGWRERTEAANKKINDRRSDMKRVIQEDWTKPAYYVRDETGKVVEWPMMGGSLKGIEEKLDYLKSLGVTCIYLNPVFEAASNHRYDTGDYMHIDELSERILTLRSLQMQRGRRGYASYLTAYSAIPGLTASILTKWAITQRCILMKKTPQEPGAMWTHLTGAGSSLTKTNAMDTAAGGVLKIFRK